MDHGLTLLTCGCQLPGFVCITCKRKYTYMSLPLLPAYPTGPAATAAYYKYNCCTLDTKRSEFSGICPKRVHQHKVICAPCKLETVKKLCISGKISTELQMLLELSISTYALAVAG